MIGFESQAAHQCSQSAVAWGGGEGIRKELGGKAVQGLTNQLEVGYSQGGVDGDRSGGFLPESCGLF